MADAPDQPQPPERIRVEDRVVSQGELAEWMRVSIKGMERLSARGLLSRIAQGKYLLKASVGNYIDYLRRQATGRDTPNAAARGQLLSAQARIASIKEAVLRGDLMRKVEVEAEWSSSLRILKAACLALPARLAGRLPHLSLADIDIIDHEVRDFLVQLADPVSFRALVEVSDDPLAASEIEAEPVDRDDTEAA